MKNPFVFQVFSLPLFSFTGATSIVQKYNIQIVGYIDEAIVRFHVLSNRDETEYFSYLNNSVKFSGGRLQLNGSPLGRASFSLAEISAYQLAYSHPGGLQPSVDRFRLQLSTAALSDRRLFLRRSLRSSSSAAGFDGRLSGQRPVSRTGRQRQDNLHRSRTRRNYVAHSEIELPVRIVRLYENMKETALKLDSVFRVYHGTALCFNAEALLTQDSLQAARSDFVDLLFAVKVQPTQGTLIRRSKLLTAASLMNATGRIAQTVVADSPTPRPSLSLDLDAEEATRIDLVRLSELEDGDICYWNRRRDTRTDVIGLKQVGRLDFPTVAVNLDIQPKPRYQLSKQSKPAEVLHVRETANYVALNPTVLRHVLQPTRQWSLSARNLIPLMPSPSDVVYTVTRHPRFAEEEGPSGTQDAGRLVSLSAVSSSSHEGDTALRPGLATHLRDLSPPAVDWFTQAQVDSGDVVFVPPIKDVGPQDRNVSVQLAVSAPGINILTEEVLLIRILAEDNQTPNLELIKPVSVPRDGELPLTEEVLRLADQDTPFVNLKLTLVKRPAHGDIFVRKDNTTVSPIGTKVKMSENDTFEASLLPMSVLSYIQDGSNTKEDSFILMATDGKQTSQPLVVTVAIHPRVLHQPVWKLLVNNSILVWENASVTLHQSVFPQSDTENDSSPHDSRFFLVVAPTKGRLVLDGRKTVNQFSTADVTNSRIAYRHGPAEIGIKPQVDIARIWDFRSGKIFSLNFTLTPVNSQVPKLVSKTALHVKEGNKVVLGSQILSVYDVDTEEENINIRLIHPPRWGHLELCIENVTVNTSQDNAAFAFTARDLMDSRVWYVNSRHAAGQESAGDVFSVRAYDEVFASAETLEIKVIIQPMNDEVPVVRLLNHFSVPEGGRRILTPHLFAVSDRDVPRDILQIHFPQLPTYGVLSVYWHYGERHVITAHSAPIAETYLGMLNLLYVQNSSLLPRTHVGADAGDGRYPSFSSYGPHVLAVDQFTVSVSDGLHEVVKTARILIRRPNRMKPSVISDHSSGILTLTGSAWKLLNALPGGLRVVDEDSADEDVLVRLTRAPRLGHLERLPRRTSVENEGAAGPDDLIEAAWDAEEEQAERLGISKMELRNAGSIGGGKSAKTLGEGDSFTKRQLDSDRIYYIYTGEYTSDFVYDSCELHISDGSYEVGPITIQFRIRGTHGRPNGPSVYSQSQFMDKNYQEDRPLSDDAFSQTPSWTFNEELNIGDTTESTVFEDAEITPSPDQIIYTADGNKLRIQTSALEVALGHRSTLNAAHVQMEVLSPTNDSHTNLILNSRFEVYKIKPEQGSEMELPREMDDCIAVVQASQPRETVMKFSYKDLVSGKIAVSAENCTTVPPVKFGLTLLLMVPGQRSLTLFIPLALHPHARSRIPRLIVGDPLRVIPGTDVPLTAAQLQLATDGGGENFDPTKIYLFAADGFSSHGGYLHRRGSCNGMVAAVDLFSLFDVGNEDIIYHSPDPPLSYSSSSSSPPQPILSSSIQLMVVNLQELELALDMVHLRAFVVSLVAEARTDRTVALLQYFLGGSDKSTVQPLKLWLEPVEEEIYQPIGDNETASIHAVAPLAEKLTKVYDGYMGFFLSAEHLFARGNPSDITYTVMGANTGESGRNIISLETGEVLSRFSQEDVNRRRLAYSISYTLSYAASSKRRLKERQDKGTFQSTLSLVASRAPRGNGVGHVNSTVSLTFTWAELGFQRKRYRICASSGTLSLQLRRRGALNHKVEAYLGLSPTADIGLTEVDLLSPKLVHFAPGEDSKIIKVRVHHPQGNPEKPRQSKGYFGVTVKAPTAAVLGDNNEAQIIITSNKQCQTSSFFTPHEPAKTMKSTSLGLELPDTPKSNVRMSLTEWLTSNSLPDSNTLSKVYSLAFKKRSSTVCDEGWSLYQHRCYRFFPHHNTTWLDARNYCEQQKGYLASVTGPEFNDWIRTRLTVRAPVWIGLHKQILDGGWLWHSLEQSDYTNWEQGFPQRTRPRRRRIPKRKGWHPFMNAVDAGAGEDNTRGRYRLTSHQSRRRTLAAAPVLWQSSAASHERTKRWTGARHSSSRGERTDLVLQSAPKFCVLLGGNLGWQNQPCMRTRVPFICMKNPKVN
ncbi:FRAS1-related extracellular matrix protein 1 [Sparganum proliferum]